MSQTTIINCDICDQIFEPEMCEGHNLRYSIDRDIDVQEMDICRQCFKQHILPLNKDIL